MGNDRGPGCITILLITVAVMLFAYWKFNAVMGSDLPDWLKYFLLR